MSLSQQKCYQLKNDYLLHNLNKWKDNEQKRKMQKKYFIVKTYSQKDKFAKNFLEIHNNCELTKEQNYCGQLMLNKALKKNIFNKDLPQIKAASQKLLQKQKKKLEYIYFVKKQIQKNESNLINTKNQLASIFYRNNKKNKKQEESQSNGKNNQKHSISCFQLMINNKIRLKQLKNHNLTFSHRQIKQKNLPKRSSTSSRQRVFQTNKQCKKQQSKLIGTKHIFSARQIKLRQNKPNKQSLWANFKGKTRYNRSLKNKQDTQKLNVISFQQAIHFKKKNIKEKHNSVQFLQKQFDKLKFQAWQNQLEEYQSPEESRYGLISKIIQ